MKLEFHVLLPRYRTWANMYHGREVSFWKGYKQKIWVWVISLYTFFIWFKNVNVGLLWKLLISKFCRLRCHNIIYFHESNICVLFCFFFMLFGGNFALSCWVFFFLLLLQKYVLFFFPICMQKGPASHLKLTNTNSLYLHSASVPFQIGCYSNIA